ncbi:ABC transporter substrate-binding protein [Paracoccus sp. AK26]|uniref:ABC transporter substrate-binding protein n=1 Tax=Paracoccus sp. AK26 TaxID=2589076 RepID=UPI0014288435|nr:extracellular solute-binding protein [Paracoccus sp. AK26]QIR86520.1 extracellular solute-binding protein [Paracoccus sp. AK26]
MKYSAAALAAAIAAVSGHAALAQTQINVLRVAVNPEQEQYLEKIATDFEAQNEGVDVIFEYVANEAYKARLPTLLQSDARPDIFYSWGGQTVVEQVEAGFLQPIDDLLPQGFRETLPQAGLQAYEVEGQLYGLPQYATEVVFWANKALTDQAGIDLDAIKTWTTSFRRCRPPRTRASPRSSPAAGQMAAAFLLELSGPAPRRPDGRDRRHVRREWRLHGRTLVAAGRDFQRLTELEPFQPGYISTTYETASGMFADGAGAFHLMGTGLSAHARTLDQRPGPARRPACDHQLPHHRRPGGRGRQ